ncbi:MAG TPA: hypothetical protein PKA33_08730 [Amaricoccus sp.]|nr:hypothetical protein [Amaricoccus sp.]HMQ92598.1 hypothetical protein [Amaricoccus sp.]HMR52515.1 hypothetical protein [Amaricoccus sp.]HMR59852.1 hypothetical protein [Amaricoccus sp.]HMT99436.1 hypothetical protein [Amaricoccus sp.]
MTIAGLSAAAVLARPAAPFGYFRDLLQRRCLGVAVISWGAGRLAHR